MRPATYATQGRPYSRGPPTQPGAGTRTNRLNIGRHGSSASKTAPATKDTVCQRCEGRGHYTADCRKERTYKARPTRTQQLMNPKKQPKLLSESERFDAPSKDGTAARVLEENASKREKAAKSDDSSSASSSSGSSSGSDSGSDSGSESDSGSDSDSGRSRSASPARRKRQHSDSPGRAVSPPAQQRRRLASDE